jgi:hypothetical protein
MGHSLEARRFAVGGCGSEAAAAVTTRIGGCLRAGASGWLVDTGGTPAAGDGRSQRDWRGGSCIRPGRICALLCQSAGADPAARERRIGRDRRTPQRRERRHDRHPQRLPDYRSRQAAKRLRDTVAPQARARRDGSWVTIPRREVVPGDLLRLSAGDLIPAAARLDADEALFHTDCSSSRWLPRPWPSSSSVRQGTLCRAVRAARWCSRSC